MNDKQRDLELIKRGFAKKVYIKTSEGADYIIGYYFDLDGNYTTENNAKKIIVRECKYDGSLVKETFLLQEKDKSQSKL